MRRRPIPTACRRGYSPESRRDRNEMLCNRPHNGIAAIEDYGVEHLRSGAPILYTSQDSVIQLAAHASAVSGRRAVHDVRRAARIAVGPGRGATRDRAPVRGAAGRVRAYCRPPRLRAAPPSPSQLELLLADGIEVHGVGKAPALFDGIGFSALHAGATNSEAITSVDELLGGLRRRAGLREPDRDGPALRPSQGRRGLPPGPGRRSTLRSRAGWLRRREMI